MSFPPIFPPSFSFLPPPRFSLFSLYLVGQRLGRRDRDRVPSVHAHGVEVLDGADDDDVVRQVLFRGFLIFQKKKRAFFTPVPTPPPPRPPPPPKKKGKNRISYPHHFELILLPPEQRLLDEDLVGQGGRDTSRDDFLFCFLKRVIEREREREKER